MNELSEMDRIQCQLYSRLPVFARRVARAEAIVAEALATMPHPYVAFSSGADSQVVLDMVLRAAPHTDVCWGDDGWDFPESLAFVKAAEDHWWFTLKRIRCLNPWRDWCDEMERPDLAEQPDALEHGQPVWGNPRIWHATARSLALDATDQGYGGVFLGLLGTQRKAGGESTARWRQLRGGSRPLYQVAGEGGMWHCSPLASWTKQDVWAYIVSRGLPYNVTYDKLAALGVPLEQRRVAPLTCYRVNQFGSQTLVRRGWPSLHNRLAAIFPAVRQYS